MIEILLHSNMSIPNKRFQLRLTVIKSVVLCILCSLVGLSGCSDLSHGSKEVLTVELKTGPGVIVEVVPVHKSLADKRISNFDVNDEGMVVVVIDGSLYDLATGKQLSQSDIHISDVTFILGNLVVITTNNHLGIWSDNGIEELTNIPLNQAQVAPGKTGEFLVWGKTPEGGHALFSFKLEGSPEFLSGSPLPILNAAASLKQTWFSVEESLFSITESGKPELVLTLPDDTSLIIGMALSGGRKYFSTTETVFLLHGAVAMPLVIGIGGQIRTAAGGIFVLDNRLGHLYRIVGDKSESSSATIPIEPAPEEGENSRIATPSPTVKDDLEHVIFSLSKSHIAAYILLVFFIIIVIRTTRSNFGEFLLSVAGFLITWEVLAFHMEWKPTAINCLWSLSVLLLTMYTGRALMKFITKIISDHLQRWIVWIIFFPAAGGFLAGIGFAIVFGYSWFEYMIIYIFTIYPQPLSAAAKTEMPIATIVTIGGFLTFYANFFICKAVINNSSQRKQVSKVSAVKAAIVHDIHSESLTDETLSLTIEPRNIKGLYGTLVGIMFGFILSFFFPLESIFLPIIGWFVGSELLKSGNAKRRSLATFIGTLAGTLVMLYFENDVSPVPVLMLIPLFTAITGWNLERYFDRLRILRPFCSQCGKRVKTDNRVRCVACGHVFHIAVCTIRRRDGSRYCRSCYEEIKGKVPEPEGADTFLSKEEDTNKQAQEPEPGSTIYESDELKEYVNNEDTDCLVCSNGVMAKNMAECSSCGAIVHHKHCSIGDGIESRLCLICYNNSKLSDESEAIEEISVEENDSDEMLTIESSLIFGPVEEELAVSLNRLFAACRSMRGYNLVGYTNARYKLDLLKEELEKTPVRMSMIENRTFELSGNTFHWDP